MLVADNDLVLCHLSEVLAVRERAKLLPRGPEKNASGSSSEMKLTGFTKT